MLALQLATSMIWGKLPHLFDPSFLLSEDFNISLIELS